MGKFLFICSALIFISNIALSEVRSLKNTKVNVRLGPSKNYPIKFVYEKKYLPVIIIDEHYNWRKIKDYDNDTGWIHISQLSKVKTTVTTKDNQIVHSSPSIYSKPKAKPVTVPIIPSSWQLGTIFGDLGIKHLRQGPVFVKSKKKICASN